MAVSSAEVTVEREQRAIFGFGQGIGEAVAEVQRKSQSRPGSNDKSLCVSFVMRNYSLSRKCSIASVVLLNTRVAVSVMKGLGMALHVHMT